MTLATQAAVTPAGKPVATPIPVAPVVLCVMLVMAVLTHVLAEPGPLTVFTVVTVITPVAFAAPHPPVSGID